MNSKLRMQNEKGFMTQDKKENAGRERQKNGDSKPRDIKERTFDYALTAIDIYRGMHYLR